MFNNDTFKRVIAILVYPRMGKNDTRRVAFPLCVSTKGRRIVRAILVKIPAQMRQLSRIAITVSNVTFSDRNSSHFTYKCNLWMYLNILFAVHMYVLICIYICISKHVYIGYVNTEEDIEAMQIVNIQCKYCITSGFCIYNMYLTWTFLVSIHS